MIIYEFASVPGLPADHIHIFQRLNRNDQNVDGQLTNVPDDLMSHRFGLEWQFLRQLDYLYFRRSARKLFMEILYKNAGLVFPPPQNRRTGPR